MVKLLFVAEALQRNSGVTSVLLSYMKFLDRSKIDINLLTYKEGNKDIINDIKNMNIGVYYMPQLSLTNVREFNKALINFFKTHKMDIVHSHFNQIDSLVFDVAHKFGVKMCISHSHNSKLSDNKIKAFRNRIMCIPIRWKADVWAACSVDAGKCLFGKAFNKNDKSIILRNGVDCDKYIYNSTIRTKMREELNYSSKDIVIGMVGGFRLQKNYERMIEIFERLLKYNSNYKLVLVGDGELREHIENIAKRKGLICYIKFLGTRSDISDLLNAFDVFVMTSFYEGLPVVAIEAQANGLQCILSSSITKDVNVTECVFVRLDDNDDCWCNAIELCKKEHVPLFNDRVKSAGFDIKKTCEVIQEKYLTVEK